MWEKLKYWWATFKCDTCHMRKPTKEGYMSAWGTGQECNACWDEFLTRVDKTKYQDLVNEELRLLKARAEARRIFSEKLCGKS